MWLISPVHFYRATKVIQHVAYLTCTFFLLFDLPAVAAHCAAAIVALPLESLNFLLLDLSSAPLPLLMGGSTASGCKAEHTVVRVILGEN